MHHNPNRNTSIAFVNQHYYPDLAATALNLTDLCEYLAGQGYDVHVYCSRGHYLSGKLRAPAYEEHNGVKIHRLQATSFGRTSNLGRMIDYVSFFLVSFFRLIIGRRFDFICTLTTPPMIGLMGTFAATPAATHHIIWSMDLHPDAEVALGMMDEQSPVTRLLHYLNRFSYRQADMVVSLGPYMSRRIVEEYGVNEENVTEISIWSDKREIEVHSNGKADNAVPEHLKGRFIINYSGNMGLVHSFNEICEVMKKFRNQPDVGFTFSGDGPRKQELMDFAQRENIENVAFLPYVDREELSESLAKADVHWLSLRPKFAGMAVPGKCYGYMASGRPVIFIGPKESDNASDILAGKCGYVCEPGEAESVVQAVNKLMNDPELRDKIGSNARNYFESYADRKVSCESWEQALRRLEYQKQGEPIEQSPVSY